MSLLTQIFGSRNDRILKPIQQKVDQVEILIKKWSSWSDLEIQEKSRSLVERAQKNKNNHDKTLDIESLAVACLGAQRVLGLTPYRVQMVGAFVLHEGKIAEMRTGEGKTLTAALASYMNAIYGRGVHVVTVNDYLARRDSEQMGKIHRFLGLSVGLVYSGMDYALKKPQYDCDVTYGTNSEIGFDFLRDNMALARQEQIQRGQFYAIVDEVDSILIDEARTPLIISGQALDTQARYAVFNEIAQALDVQPEEKVGDGDYWKDEKQKQIHLTEKGMSRVEELLKEKEILGEEDSLYAPHNVGLIYHINAAVRAVSLYHKNIAYIVKDDEVHIVDEFTGRVLPGRRWGDGLHQAIEAKEGVKVQAENQTVASITLQNLFRGYEKLAGMTGTADTEAAEFADIYNLEVVVIPTHKPMIREDYADHVFLTHDAKMRRLLSDIQDIHATKRPVLLGTSSIKMTEVISEKLTQLGLAHQILNAKQHEQESHIIAQAGRPGAITIATNMAGRGTDILLGGSLQEDIIALGDSPSPQEIEAAREQWKIRHQEVIDAGGLFVMGTDRHESRRIDNQLRGRAGRQGDPGASRFYVSFEDDLLRLFAPDWAQKSLRALGMKEDDIISTPMVSKQIERAQRTVERHFYDMRKDLLKFDDVANDQRKTVYQWRNYLMDEEDPTMDMREWVKDVIASRVSAIYDRHQHMTGPDLWKDAKGMWAELGLDRTEFSWDEVERVDSYSETQLAHILTQHVWDWFEQKKIESTSLPEWNDKIRGLLLLAVDQHWRDHLVNMDLLRKGIHLRGFAQKDPKQEYKREAFSLFSDMVSVSREDGVRFLVRVVLDGDQKKTKPAHDPLKVTSIPVFDWTPVERAVFAKSFWNTQMSVNTPQQHMERRHGLCSCGSGLKYRQCHGKLTEVERV